MINKVIFKLYKVIMITKTVEVGNLDFAALGQSIAY